MSKQNQSSYFDDKYRAYWSFPDGSVVKNPPAKAGYCLDPWVGKIPLEKKWQPTPVFLPGKYHGWWNLVGCSSWGCEESDTTERLHFTSAVKNPLASAGDAGLSPGSGRSLEKEMATHSSIPAWRTPRTEEAARLHTVHGASQESDMA